MLNKKKILRNSTVYIILGFLPLAVNFLLSPLYSHILSAEQNAILGQAMLFQGILGPFLGLSIDSAFSRFYFDYYKDEKLLNQYVSTILLFILLFSVIIFFIIMPFGNKLLLSIQKNKIFTFTEYGIWVFATTICVILQSVFLAFYRNEEKVIMFSVVSLGYFFVSLAFVLIGLLYFKAEAMGNIAGRALSYLIVTIILLLFFFKKTGFHFNFKFLKESLKYSVPVVPYLLLMTLYGNVDRVMVEHNFTVRDLGIYNFAFVISGAVSVFISSGQNVLGPILYRLLKDNPENSKEVNGLFSWFHFICTALVSTGLCFAFIFIRLFINKDYHSMINYIGILFIAYIFRIYYLIYVDALFFYKKTKWISLITLASLIVGILSNFFLIPLFGIQGVCISVIIINFTQAFGAYIQTTIYKINKSYYTLPLNHFYTGLIIGGYFISLYLSSKNYITMNVVNNIPFAITLFFAGFFIYRNKQIVHTFLTKLLKKQ